jgi:lipopolysaccharide export system protein LptA
MSKYVEELNSGEFFELDNNIYLITSDFKKSGDRMTVDTKTGNIRWFSGDNIIEQVDLYMLSSENNFTPLNPRLKDAPYQT